MNHRCACFLGRKKGRPVVVVTAGSSNFGIGALESVGKSVVHITSLEAAKVGGWAAKMHENHQNHRENGGTLGMGAP